MVRTSVTHSAIASCATFLFLPHFDVICDLLLDRCTATWNLFVKTIVMRSMKYFPMYDAKNNVRIPLGECLCNFSERYSGRFRGDFGGKIFFGRFFWVLW